MNKKLVLPNTAMFALVISAQSVSGCKITTKNNKCKHVIMKKSVNAPFFNVHLRIFYEVNWS